MAILTGHPRDEAVAMDAGRIRNIIQELGETAAENVLCLALEQLASTVHALEHAPDRSTLVLLADQIARLAWQIGLVSLAGVAVDVGYCCDRSDDVAVRATTARLIRIAHQSMTTIWDQTDGAGGVG